MKVVNFCAFIGLAVGAEIGFGMAWQGHQNEHLHSRRIISPPQVSEELAVDVAVAIEGSFVGSMIGLVCGSVASRRKQANETAADVQEQSEQVWPPPRNVL